MSDPISADCQTKLSDLRGSISISDVTQTSLRASWPASSDVGVSYEFACAERIIVNETSATCSGLASGLNVSVQVRAAKTGFPNDRWSSILRAHVKTKLFPVESSSVQYSISTTSISVAWHKSQTDGVSYNLTCTGPSGSSVLASSTTAACSPLLSGEAYSLSVTVVKTGFENAVTQLGTKLTKLCAVANSSAEFTINQTAIAVSWNASQTSSVSYLLECRGNSVTKATETGETSATCDQLEPGQPYRVWLRVTKSGGFDDAVTQLGLHRTDEAPSGRVRNLRVSAGSAGTAVVEFEDPEMKNGVLLAYAIQVTQPSLGDPSLCSQLMVLTMSSESCQLASCITAQIIEELAAECGNQSITVPQQYTGQPLKVTVSQLRPGINYTATVTPVSQTRRGQAAVRAFCLGNCRGLAEWQVIALYAGVPAAVAALAVAMTVAAIIRVSRRQKRPSSEAESSDVVTRMRPRPQGSLTPKDLTYSLILPCPTGALLPDFVHFASGMLADACVQSDRQYEQLKAKAAEVARGLTKEAASDPSNKEKNRFVNILPFDHNRVHLSSGGDGQSDYVNASFVPGLSTDGSRPEFIASQGPRPNTTADHWRFVWEQSVRVIVMLTACVEKGKAKCESYWPDVAGERLSFGRLEVELTGVKQTDAWVAREMRLREAGEEGASREVTQMQYLAWDDHSVPNLDELAEFLNSVRNRWAELGRDGSCGPILVHCSAGVGRTGTFLALDMLARRLQTAQADSWISVYDTVLELRQSRVDMVQTKHQYSFIYRFLLNYLSKRKRLTFMSDDFDGPADPVYVRCRDNASFDEKL